MDINGYKVNFLGDSITEGVGVSSEAARYDTLLAKMCGYKQLRYKRFQTCPPNTPKRKAQIRPLLLRPRL